METHLATLRAYPEQRTRLRCGVYALLVLLLSLVTAALVAEIAASLRWRLMHDSPLLHYVAFAVDRYDLVPYRDIFDMNFPGTYLFHLLIGRCFGYGDLAARLVDLSLLGVLSAITWRIMSRLGRWIALAGVVCFAYSYLRLGPTQSLQRDFIGLVPVVLAVLVGTSGTATRWRAFTVGIVFGLAFTIKPHLLVGLPLVLVHMFCEREDQCAGGAQEWLYRSIGLGASAIAGLAVPCVVAVLWLWHVGALRSFVEMATSYLPLYAQLSGQHKVLSGLEREVYLLSGYSELGGSSLWLIPALLGAYIALTESTLDTRQRRLVKLLIGLVLAYAAYPVFAGKFWPYHWLPFQYMVITAAPLVLVAIRPELPANWRSVFAVALFGWTSITALCPASSLRLASEVLPSERTDNPYADQIVAYLQPRLRPGDTVQPLDWTGGAVHAMLILQAQIATPYMYDFHFYHHVTSPCIQDLRSRFIRSLQIQRPRFIIQMIHRPWPWGASTTRRFRELDRLIHKNYVIAEQTKAYIIWESRTDSGA